MASLTCSWLSLISVSLGSGGLKVQSISERNIRTKEKTYSDHEAILGEDKMRCFGRRHDKYIDSQLYHDCNITSWLWSPIKMPIQKQNSKRTPCCLPLKRMLHLPLSPHHYVSVCVALSISLFVSLLSVGFGPTRLLSVICVLVFVYVYLSKLPWEK